MKLTLKQALNRGVEAHKKGRIQEAEVLGWRQLFLGSWTYNANRLHEREACSYRRADRKDGRRSRKLTTLKARVKREKEMS